MTSSVPTPDLARAWAELGAQWAQWWTQAARSPRRRQAAFAPPPERGAAASALGFVDPAARAALDARIAGSGKRCGAPRIGARAPRAATRVSRDRADAARRPPLRGRAWRELPYFALLKQAYLLASDYLSELAALAALPEHDKQRLVFMIRQYVDALAPTNFAATNPEVHRARARDRRA